MPREQQNDLMAQELHEVPPSVHGVPLEELFEAYLDYFEHKKNL